MTNITVDSTWKLNQNTDRNGLQGIYVKTYGEGICTTCHLAAVDLTGKVIAHSKWGVAGNAYRHAQREFGNQLEQVLGNRLGY